MEHGGRAVSVDAPLPTITTARAARSASRSRSWCRSTARTESRRRGRTRDRRADANDPGERRKFGLVEPFVVELSGTGDDNLPRSARDIDEPLGTVRAGGTHHAVVQPFLLGQHGGATARPVDEPAPTIATDGAISLIEPYLTQYYGSGSGLIARSTKEPLPPVTTKERFALVEPLVIDGKTLDIRFRMLKPHELSAAMGFPADYEFTGTKTDHVKQIGNAVSVRTAQALCMAALGLEAQPSRRERSA
jgi:DNA (cytosine-5)-methyltransferase 1